MFRGMLSVGGWTLVSRLTGFVRDVVMAAIMGAGPVADAFVVSLRLPNHLRTIFGEGAFNSAFIPSYARLQAQGDAPARLFADRVFTLMLLVQAGLLALALVFMPQLVRLLAPGFAADPGRFALAVELTRITFPYLPLITLVTLVSAVLNANERFAAAAAAPALMNLAIVAGLALAFLFPTPGHAAAWGVTLSGALQYLLVTFAAFAIGREPWLARPRLDPEMRRFFRILGPAVVGSAGVQIAMFADTVIASFLPAGAVSALYYADRLYQLPVGVIGIAAGTVLLPEMSRRVASGDVSGAHSAQNRAVGLTLALAAPFAVAFLLVPDLIMSALFERGAFDAEAAKRAGGVLAAYGVGLPAIVLTRSALASFYARSDTTTPLLASLTAIAINIGLKLVLTGPYGVVGLALATAVGAWINLLLLMGLAYGRGWAAPTAMLARIAAAVFLASLLLGLFVSGAQRPVAGLLGAGAPFRREFILGLLGLGGLLVYGGALAVAAKGLRLSLARS